MPFDVYDPQDRARLHKAKKTSRDAIQTNFRLGRTEMIRNYVGSYYSPTGARFLTYVNAINQTLKIFTAALAYNNPQVKVTTWEQSKWPFCRKYEVNINKVVSNIDLKTTMQEGVLDACFLMGIFNVRMADAGEVDLGDNVWIDPGQVWVDRISFDDAILDLSAKSIRTMRFFGHRYRASYRKVQTRDDFDKYALKKISPTSKFSYDVGSDYASQIATGQQVDDDELEPMVWLEDVYLPETKQLVTFSADQDSLPPLKVQEQDQGPFGPYEFLGLGLVPDNIIPSAPAQNLKPLHDLRNSLYRKEAAQALRQKNVVAFSPGAEDDAERMKNAKDGEYIKVREPKSLTPVSFPGVDGNTHAFSLAAAEDFNTEAGNPRAIGGLGREADTVGQEQIVQGHAMGMISFMKAAVNQCAANICRKIGALMWDDEALTVESTMEAEHSGYYVDTSWRPGERNGIKDQYDFSVEPNSMGYRPPEAKLQFVMQYLQSVGTIFPLVQAGILDLQELNKFAAEYGNVPELQRMFKAMQQPGTMGDGADQHQATKPAVTSRETVRSNRSTGPSAGGMAAIAGQFMQGKMQPSQGVKVGG